MKPKKLYPPEVVDNPKRIKQWDNPKDKNGRIKTIGFRPSTVKAYREALRFNWKAEDQGSSNCYQYSMLIQAFNASQDRIETPKKPLGGNTFNIQMNIQSNYTPQVPRREPKPFHKSNTSGTIIKRAMEAYVLLKALPMEHTFTCRDFLELSSNAWKKVISRLKRQGLIKAEEPRSWIRTYRLTLKFLYPLAKEYAYKISEFNLGQPHPNIENNEMS
jgi:hypothetical protein